VNTVINNRIANYVDVGSGKVILILHGWGSSNKVFAEVVQELSKTWRVVAPDFPGFGGSAEPDTAWGVAGYVDWTRQFMAKVGFTPTVILGHSFGGRVVLKGVGENILQPEKIILVDSAGIKPRQTATKQALAGISKVGKVLFRGQMGEKIRTSVYRKIGASDYVNASPLMKEVFKKTVSEDLRKYIPKIKTKSLIIWGENDLDTPVTDAQELAKIAGAQLKIVAGAGHYVFLDKKTEVIKAIKEFLA
jgi:pimeloyl-ACP methyl ester carboxylesterase